MVKGLVLVRSNAKGLWSVFGAFLSYYGDFLPDLIFMFLLLVPVKIYMGTGVRRKVSHTRG
eukprot:SAG11_NODE_913_length_6579_cov_3.562963_1_plen_60_part_10